MNRFIGRMLLVLSVLVPMTAFGQFTPASWSFAFSPDHCAGFRGSQEGDAPATTQVGTYANGFPSKGFLVPSYGGALESPYLLCPIMYPFGFTGNTTFYVDLLWASNTVDAAKYVRWQTDLVFTQWGGKTGEYVKSDDSTVTAAWEEAQDDASSQSAQANTEIITRTGQVPYLFSYNDSNTPKSAGQMCTGLLCAGKHGVLRIQRVPTQGGTELNATAHLVWVIVWAP